MASGVFVLTMAGNEIGKIRGMGGFVNVGGKSLLVPGG